MHIFKSVSFKVIVSRDFGVFFISLDKYPKFVTGPHKVNFRLNQKVKSGN
jgi:hypothetical protein